jgi:hypothetical protein
MKAQRNAPGQTEFTLTALKGRNNYFLYSALSGLLEMIVTVTRRAAPGYYRPPLRGLSTRISSDRGSFLI